MKRHFVFSIRISVFAAVCFGSFLWLGFWQLDREKEKISMIAGEALQALETPQTLAGEIDQLALVDGQRVKISGEYDPKVVLLLDNRVLEGKVGFEVHQLFNENSGNAALVNRGFVPMGRTRTDSPAIPPVSTGEITITGRVHYPVAPMLAPDTRDESFEDLAFPVIVQHPDLTRLKRHLGDRLQGSLAAFVVRADADAPGALPRYWPTTVMLPERHRAYAVQWFAMAVAVLLAWAAVSFPRQPQ